MKYWIEGGSENGYGEKGILMKGDDQKILSVVKNGDDIRFMEECDGYYCEIYSKEEALELVDELREWINAI